MTIQLNGQPHPLESETPLPDFLKKIGLEGKPVVVEHNQEAILPKNFHKTKVRPGDNLEIVTLAAGG